MSKVKSAFELAIVENVKKKRKELNRPQSYIAMILDVSDGYVGQIESRNYPSMYSLNQLNIIAKDFECSPKDFMPEKSI
ncbi:helix-turn-helix domain-containing protein [Emticicia sp. TH156]|uniref:helix-turn-helix domain-containing protein n=1 Tax=Emticicia sp. TH156 TaxID=2067454 RepID=UPI000C78B772|nr:helix-turn-helix transcriptional regulator [Emticicia sp. TH156]PLK45778.1 transcriptional regulator [Emticicia sp. TH156]